MFLVGQGEVSLVPNAPCGVESLLNELQELLFQGFLMHRVELKGILKCIVICIFVVVPNAPCGVERKAGDGLWKGKPIRS